MMTKTNLKLAVRVLWNDRLNAFLNLLGLSVGITCFLLIGFYVKQEMSFDRFHDKSDRIYRVWLNEDYGDGKIFFNSVTPLVFESTLSENFAEFEHVVQFDWQNYLVGEGDDRLNESVAIITPTFFDVFDFELIQGKITKPLENPNSIVLSQSYAQKYFGTDDPIDKKLTIQIRDEQREFSVSAIYEDIGKESSIQFDMAISNANNKMIYGERALTAWFNVSAETYVLVDEVASISSVEASIPKVVMQYLGDQVDEGVYNIGFQPLTDIHLNEEIPPGIAPVGNRSYVYILGAISLLVFTIACVNYTTLSIGQSLKRNKEVGVRKVMGAFKNSILNQYLTESLLVATLSLVVGTLIAILFTPAFNNLTGANVEMNFQAWHLIVYGGIILIIGVASGFYPAFVLSRLKITAILQGGMKVGRTSLVRKGMVVFQFMITVFLISSSLIMRSQLNYLHTKDLGFNYDATVSVPLYPSSSSRSFRDAVSSAREKGSLLREKLNQYPVIADIGMGSHVFGTSGWASLAFTDNTETFRRFRYLSIDPFYFSTFGMDVIRGRAFDPKNPADEKTSVIINQKAAEYFGLGDAIGKQLPGDFDDHVIIGVTDNFNFSSLQTEVEPLVISQNQSIVYSGISDNNFGDSPIPKLVFRYTGSQLTEVKTILEKEWESTFPDEDLDFAFVEENMKFQYASEEQMNKLVTVATALSIVIASLGLLGLTVLVVNSRVKEISIRKVIGATEMGIFGLLARNFSVQLVLGIVLSIPITWWLMNNWLNEFAYRISISPLMFLLSTVISLTIAFVVISFHSLKAAMTNPATTLRME